VEAALERRAVKLGTCDREEARGRLGCSEAFFKRLASKHVLGPVKGYYTFRLLEKAMNEEEELALAKGTPEEVGGVGSEVPGDRRETKELLRAFGGRGRKKGPQRESA
jgi:hypothetical protein